MTAALPPDARHLSLNTLDLIWSKGAPMMVPLSGSPSIRLRLDPANGRLTLTTPYSRPEPNTARLAHIDYQAVVTDDGDIGELTVAVPEGSLHGVYGLLTTVADELQIEGRSLAGALAIALERHKDMLSTRGALTTEAEVGLVGELLVLQHAVEVYGAAAAVSSWQGPLNEEHDFALPGTHIEVKTTTSEARRHVIHGLGQLVPLSIGLPLHLVSVQLTRTNHHDGQTLSGIVESLRTSAPDVARDLDERMAGAGWRNEDADLYTTAWAMRSRPRAYLVDDSFPALTPERVAAVAPNPHLISAVAYQVDVTPLPHTSLPALTGFVEDKEH
ncbi:PD-(D/E)XK motif protein [Kocuria sp. CPCC 205263]|uniref:PD-(D/E)XK motif protein n=1 Tax=Kocuria sp. CPCC 205263 TaxID=3073555 RepID=UPI0034D42F10